MTCSLRTLGDLDCWSEGSPIIQSVECASCLKRDPKHAGCNINLLSQHATWTCRVRGHVKQRQMGLRLPCIRWHMEGYMCHPTVDSCKERGCYWLSGFRSKLDKGHWSQLIWIVQSIEKTVLGGPDRKATFRMIFSKEVLWWCEPSGKILTMYRTMELRRIRKLSKIEVPMGIHWWRSFQQCCGIGNTESYVWWVAARPC